MNAREIAICSRVRTSREDVKDSQSLFAQTLGTTRPTIASIEYGNTPLRYSLAVKICAYCRISPLWLATGKGAMHTWAPLTESTELGLPENALFSEVFDKFFISAFETESVNRNTESRDCLVTLSDRLRRLGLIHARLADWITDIPDDALEKFDQAVTKAIDDIGEKCGVDRWHSIVSRINTIQGFGIDASDAQSKEKSIPRTEDLTSYTEFRSIPPVKREFTLPQLLADLRRVTSPPGMKAKLAKHLKVPEARVYEWLRGKYIPSGEMTLELLNWVRAQDHK